MYNVNVYIELAHKTANHSQGDYMKLKKGYYIIPILLILLTISSHSATATSDYADEVPGALVGACHTCHVDPAGGGTLTDFGVDYTSGGYSFESIADKDSDGDGALNSAELEEGTNPGDLDDAPAAEGEIVEDDMNTEHPILSAYPTIKGIVHPVYHKTLESSMPGFVPGFEFTSAFIGIVAIAAFMRRGSIKP